MCNITYEGGEHSFMQFQKERYVISHHYLYFLTLIYLNVLCHYSVKLRGCWLPLNLVQYRHFFHLRVKSFIDILRITHDASR